MRADSPAEIAAIARAQWNLGLENAVLVGNPPPAESALPPAAVAEAIAQALVEAKAANVRGSGVTPFLLERVSRLSHGASLQTNLALLKNNARLAALVARELATSPYRAV